MKGEMERGSCYLAAGSSPLLSSLPFSSLLAPNSSAEFPSIFVSEADMRAGRERERKRERERGGEGKVMVVGRRRDAHLAQLSLSLSLSLRLSPSLIPKSRGERGRMELGKKEGRKGEGPPLIFSRDTYLSLPPTDELETSFLS